MTPAGRRLQLGPVYLYAEVTGEGFPLLLLHGFTGSARSWDGVAGAWADEFRVIAVDLIGHGRTEAPPDVRLFTMERVAADLWRALDLLTAPRCALLGYSMGARLALHMALAAPGRVAALVLESGTYGIADPLERQRRRESDGELADWIERAGVEAFAERWAELPLFATQASLPHEVREAQRRERLMHTPTGLALSLRGMGTGAQGCLLDRLGELEIPVLLVSGTEDEKFTALAREMQARIPSARHLSVAGAGHNVHLERPGEFQAAVLRFLRETVQPHQSKRGNTHVARNAD